MEATIKFVNGEQIVADQNGTCYIVDVKPEIPDDLSVVEVENEDGTIYFNDAFVIECASVDGRYWFAFGEESPLDKQLRVLHEENDLLTECILEMSEIIYGE